MKKLYLVFLLVFVSHTFGQTYTVTVSFSGRFFCNYSDFNWGLSSGGTSIGGNNDISDIQEKTFSNVANYDSFNFYLNAASYEEPCISVQDECIRNTTVSSTASSLIQYPNLRLGGCDFMVGISEFKPNVTIRNLNTTTPNEICAGAQLDLAAFPAGFPSEAYHWQYSKDNQATWIDIPLTLNGIPTNNITTTTIYMQQLLGDSHTDYIGKQIYFRLGYDQTRNFTDALAITYMPCAPVMESIVYKAPKCNGDAISQFDVTFDRPLKTELSEDIYSIKMKDVDNGIERNERQNITSIGTTPPYTYSFTNLDALEKGRTYRIVYQTRIKDPADPSKKILKGFIESTQTFTYNEPPPLTFGLEGNNPICHNDTVSITITANGGSGEYYYYSIDGGSPIRFSDKTKVSTSIVNGAVTEIRTGSQIIDLATSAKLEYNIIVTDGNNCIEKKISP